MSRSNQSVNWCFTLNNYTTDEENAIRGYGLINANYCVYGKEVGELGTPHLQGYIELKTRQRLTQLKKNMDLERIHLEPRKAKAHQAADYCKKDGDFWECGEAPTPPKNLKEDTKKRWREVLTRCQDGDWAYMAENEPYLWLMNEKKLRSHYKCAKDIDTLENEWIYGPTGTGKSRYARDLHPNAYIKDASTQWWDGYNGEDVVIIDDLDKYHVKMGYYLKVWADHYAFPAQIKGGQMMARPKKIIVTSNYHPSEIWQDSTTVDPIKRRFTMIHRDLPFQALTSEATDEDLTWLPEFGRICD
jgi:hypothetical protein